MISILVLISTGMLAQTANITLKVQGITEAKGLMSIALFDNEEDYSSEENYAFAGEIPVESKDFEYVIKDLPYGIYAIKVFFDMDSNGEMKKNWIGMPKEPFGFSNDAKAKMGPPSFENASFVVKGNTDAVVNLVEL